jgi:MoaA/NifB/PqqE/SkfB family radical SAM enzyme
MKVKTLNELGKQIGWTKNDWIKNDIIFDPKSFQVDLPQDARNKVISLMIEEEKKNFNALYKSEVSDIFKSSKVLQHCNRIAQLIEDPKKVTPVTIEFHPSNCCNHKCPECCYTTPTLPNKFRKHWDMNLFPQFLEDINEMNVKAITLSGGGEPLIHPNINEIISGFKENGQDVGLITNGGMLDLEKCDVIVKNCTWCRVSIDAASQEKYDMMHGQNISNSFDELVEKVKILADAKLKHNSEITLGVSFLLTPFNYTDLIPFINMFSKIEGLNYGQIKPLICINEVRNKSEMFFWDKRIFDALNAISAYSTDEFKIYSLSYKFYDLIANEGKMPFNKCFGHPLYPTVGADGSVFICCNLLLNYIEGNPCGRYGQITDKCSFIELWATDKRFRIGDNIDLCNCPTNCKLSESNKILKEIFETPTHINFLN